MSLYAKRVIRSFKDGDAVPEGSRYLYSKEVVVGYDPASHQMLNDTPVYGVRHWYEVTEYVQSVEAGS